MTQQNLLFEVSLRMGDNALILGHRLSQWCGRGPVLEQDIAITNIALDLIGQARAWLSYAGEVEGAGRDEDQLAYLRDAGDFRNVLLVEQPNEDWAYTIVRQFLFDVFHYYYLEALRHSKDERIVAIAAKSLKEVSYHLRYSSEWMIRLGDGTDESHEKMQNALDDLWMFSGELYTPDDTDHALAAAGLGGDLELLAPRYAAKVDAILGESTLRKPDRDWMQSGGKQGRHNEHLGYILAELQFLQRAYPGLEW
jgi:ring-1,2-phenylacetyl-CoA epoxidase subunit PaaC